MTSPVPDVYCTVNARVRRTGSAPPLTAAALITVRRLGRGLNYNFVVFLLTSLEPQVHVAGTQISEVNENIQLMPIRLVRAERRRIPPSSSQS